MEDDITYCVTKIAEEEQMARECPSAEAAEIHNQIVMLYRAQLNLLHRKLNLIEIHAPARKEAA